ncbi:MAG: aminoglycoside phosphotransferase [Chloroflexi bacterium]|nr:MAG: aminoglycoside phosphotransferase [Chloroflexota bacterium]
MTDVFASLDELLATLGGRAPFSSADSLSGSRFERVDRGSERLILKYVSVDDDWIMRACGDLNCRQLTLLESGLLDRLLGEIDNAVVAAAPFQSRHGHRGAALLMRDVGAHLIPAGGAPVDVDTHLRFLDRMAGMHAAYWGWRDDVGLMPLAHHYVFLTPTMAAIEAGLDAADPVPRAVAEGWAALRRSRPESAAALDELVAEPAMLASALARFDLTLVHGDWKFGNLGAAPDGRTVLLDWDRCGAAPPAIDLAWYLAVNCDRLPHSKEEAIDAYRGFLERRGIATAPWWDDQLALALLGAFLQLGWSKIDDAAEFGWWDDRLAEGMRRL